MRFKALMRVITTHKIKGTHLDLTGLALDQAQVDELLLAIDHNQEYKHNLCVLKFGNTPKVSAKKHHSFTSLILDGYTSLAQLEVADVGLKELTVKGCPKLESLYAQYNQLITADLNGALNLRNICLNNNHLSSFPATQFVRLYRLKLSNNNIRILDISGLENFGELHVQDNPLVTLLVVGTYFPDSIHYDSSQFDAVTLRTINTRRARSPKFFIDHNPNQYALQIAPYVITAAAIIANVKSMVTSYTQSLAPIDLTKAAASYAITAKFTKRFPGIPDDILAQIAAYEFADLAKDHFATIRKHLQFIWTPEELAQFDSIVKEFLPQSYRVGCKVLAKNKALLMISNKPDPANPVAAPALAPRSHKTLLFSMVMPGNIVSRLVERATFKLTGSS